MRARLGSYNVPATGARARITPNCYWRTTGLIFAIKADRAASVLHSGSVACYSGFGGSVSVPTIPRSPGGETDMGIIIFLRDTHARGLPPVPDGARSGSYREQKPHPSGSSQANR